MTNGYKVIDLQGKQIKESSLSNTVIPGIYDAIESSYKPILLCGIVVNDTTDKEYLPTYVHPIVSGTEFTFTIDTYPIFVNDDDEIYWYTES